MRIKNIFYNDVTLDEYEKTEQWEKSIEYLTKKSNEKNRQKDVILRLAVQSWYVLTFWDCCMPKERLQRHLFEASLQNAYIASQKYMQTDSDYLWLFGYLMSINQIDFSFVDNDIQKIESLGVTLISEAYAYDPNNILAEILVLVNEGEALQGKRKKKQLKPYIKEYFPSDSEVDKYFGEIFTSNY